MFHSFACFCFLLLLCLFVCFSVFVCLFFVCVCFGFFFFFQIKVLIYHSAFYYFTQCSTGTVKSTRGQLVLFFVFFSANTRSSLLTGIRALSVSQKHREFNTSRFLWQNLVCALIIHKCSQILFSLRNSHWITFPYQLCLIFYSFCASLLFSFIMWLSVLSIFPRKSQLLLFNVLSIFTLI